VNPGLDFHREGEAREENAKDFSWLRLCRAVEFVANKTSHEFHELTRIKFSTASEEFTAG